MEDAVRVHLRSDVPIGAYLSTGVDSSAIAALAAPALPGPLLTFTVAFPDSPRDELRHRQTLDRFPGFPFVNERVTCDASALDRYPEVLWHVEDPTASALEVPQFLLAEAVGRRLKVVLTGEGADELFGGYAWFALDRRLRWLARVPLPTRVRPELARILARWRWRADLIAMSAETSLSRYRMLMGWIDPKVARVVRLPEDGRARHDPTAADGLPAGFDGWDPFDQLTYLEMTVRLPNLITPIVDRASMARGVEARLPFLDHVLVELAASVPPGKKLRGRTEKWVLRRALAGVLPDEVRRRTKHGLSTPYRTWLRGRLPDFAEELLGPARLRATGYFDPVAVAELRARCRETGRAPAAVLLAVLAVQTWDELFVRRRGRSPF
jgi:asparagine synthase (glutamine-hydrolysing)